MALFIFKIQTAKKMKYIMHAVTLGGSNDVEKYEIRGRSKKVTLNVYLSI